LLPLLVIGIFCILVSFFIGSNYGVQVLGGEHPTIKFWTFWIGVASIVIALALLIFALVFTGLMFGAALSD